MPYRYTDPKRASEPHALPDVEIWEDRIYQVTCEGCGVYYWPEFCATAVDQAELCCQSCARAGLEIEPTDCKGWFFAFGSPGHLWDSEQPNGPYPTEEAALEAAREIAGVEEEEEEKGEEEPGSILAREDENYCLYLVVVASPIDRKVQLERRIGAVLGGKVRAHGPYSDEEIKDLLAESEEEEDKEEPRNQPDEEDIFIQPDGRAYCSGKLIADIRQIGPYSGVRDDRAVFRWMEREGYYPNVWQIDDHGGHLLLSWDEKRQEFVEHKEG